MGKRYIYKIHDDTNRWCYVGSTYDPKGRFKDHKSCYNSDKHSSSAIMSKVYVPMRTYTSSVDDLKMTILEEIECDNPSSVNSSKEQEDKWIKFYNSQEGIDLLNVGNGAFVLSEKEVHEQIKQTNLIKYGCSNGTGGLPEAYDTNRFHNGGVLAFNTDNARINNEFAKTNLLIYGDKIFAGISSLKRHLESVGINCPISVLHRIVNGESSKKYSCLTGNIYLIKKNCYIDIALREEIISKFDLSLKIFDISELDFFNQFSTGSGGANFLYNTTQ